MKLADAYAPSAHMVPNNGLYGYYQKYFLDGLREPEERDPAKESIDCEKYQYEVDDKEREFYEEFYVAQGRILDVKDLALGEDLPAGKIFPGQHIKDLLDYIEISQNLGLLIAPVGWGKTVLLRYVWFYLIGQSKLLQKRVIPIYISIDLNKNQLQGNNSSGQIRDVLVREIFRERLIDVVKPFTELGSERFWDYLKRGSDRFNSLEQEEEDLNRIYTNDILQKYIFKARMEARKKDDFCFVGLKYIRNELGKIPLLILDNVDTLSLDVNQVILDESIFLSKEYNTKVLISMRKTTYGKIAEVHDGNLRAHPPVRIIMQEPDVRNYVKRRTAAIKLKIGTAKPEFTNLNYAGDIRVTFRDGTKVFDAMLDILLNDEIINALSHVAFYNLRKINSLVVKYLATGYIDEHLLVKKIIEGEFDERYGKSPLWILLSSIITDNYKTRFSEIGNTQQEGVLNLYCNGRKHQKHYLIRIHILNFAKRHGDVSVKDITEAYTKLYSISPHDMVPEIKYAICRLLYFDLLESPEHYKVDSCDDLGLIKTLHITDTGDYYRQELRNYYEYLVYMKDDVEMGDNTYGIHDCIKVNDLLGRYNEVYKYLRMVYDAEKEFLDNLKRDQRKYFMEHFSNPEGSNPHIVSAPVSSMVEFGKHRIERVGISADSVAAFENLLKEISQHGLSFQGSVV